MSKMTAAGWRGSFIGRRAAISALASSTKPAPDRAVVIQRGR